MKTRSATPEDAEQLSALAIQVWLQTYATQGVSAVVARFLLSEFSPERFEATLADPSSHVIVAESEAHILGYARVTVGTQCPVSTPAKAELATLYVQAPFLGKGVGPSLLGQAEQWAEQRHSTSMWLTTYAQNHRALSFYAKHGYQRIGITHFELGAVNHENLVLSHAGA